MDEKLNIMNISNFVDLKKKGKNYVCQCPFHKEDTASFVVSPDKNIATCFGGCNRSWDYVGFYADYKQMSRQKAYSEITGNDYKEAEKTPAELCITEINKLYEAVVSKTKTGLEVQKYFENRGFSLEEIQKFHIGFSNGRTYDLCKQLDFDDITIAETGGFNDELKDSFTGRITFPIFQDGQVVGFTCRSLNDDNLPKYLNTKETEIFKKNKILFNFDNAKRAIKQNDFVIIAEGTVDVMSYYFSGIENVVATCGVALTKQHLYQIKRFTNKVCLAFDSDNAGTKATIKSFKMLKQMGFEVTVISLKDAKDANEFMIKFGREALAKIAKKRTSIYNFMYKKMKFSENKNLFFELLNLENILIQREVLEGIAKCLKVEFEVLNEEFTNFQNENNDYYFNCILYQCVKNKENLGLLRNVINKDLLTTEEKEKLNKIYSGKFKNDDEEIIKNSYNFKTLILKFISKKMENLN